MVFQGLTSLQPEWMAIDFSRGVAAHPDRQPQLKASMRPPVVVVLSSPTPPRKRMSLATRSGALVSLVNLAPILWLSLPLHSCSLAPHPLFQLRIIDL